MGVGISKCPKYLKQKCKGVNFVQIEIFLYNLKAFKSYISKVSLHFSFGATR
jgi:hypothetical protein